MGEWMGKWMVDTWMDEWMVDDCTDSTEVTKLLLCARQSEGMGGTIVSNHIYIIITSCVC